jgi:hypothetical protein
MDAIVETQGYREFEVVVASSEGRLIQVEYEHKECPIVGRVKLERSFFKYTGVVLSNNPSTFEHACSRCGQKAPLRVQYPHIRFEPVPPSGDDIHTAPAG